MDEAVKMGDKIAVMDRGKVAQFGSPHEILTRPATELVEGLVGSNRILKRFTLIKCTETISGATPLFNLQKQKGELESLMAGRAPLDTHPVVGIIDNEGRPVGYIPMFKYSPDDRTPIEDKIVPPVKTVSAEDTLFDALGTLFVTGQRGVFCLGENGKALGLITMTDLFEAVSPDAGN